MEKFSQYRDKGSGIAPFLPIPTEPAGIYLPFHVFLYFCRVPMVLCAFVAYFAFLQWLPIGSIGKKISLFSILGIPGIWWIDLQIDGVKKGSLAKNSARLPHAGSVIAASSASPIDALYIAAIFDPIFVSCYPHTRLIEPISLFQAMLRAFYYPKLQPAAGAKMVDLETHLRNNPRRVILMFPECTTSNGRGILPMSPALLAAPRKTKVFPVNLRYTAPDITTPIPHTYLAFLWNLCSKPSHCIRIRIAEAVYNVHRNTDPTSRASSVDVGNEASSDAETLVGSEDPEGPQTREERAFMDKIGEALARLGRVKRVGLGVKEKQDFVNTWTKTRGRWR